MQSAAENNPAMGVFEPDKDAVRLLQEALRDLLDPNIGELQKSFSKGTADGIYAQETLDAIKQFQRKSQIRLDGVAGKNTLHALDARFQKGPPPPIVKSPPDRDEPLTERDVEQFLSSRMKTNVVQQLLVRPENLVVLGDFHIDEAHKSVLLDRMIRTLANRRPQGRHFHASEYFFQVDHQVINRFLNMPLLERVRRMLELPPHLLRFLPVLATASTFSC